MDLKDVDLTIPGSEDEEDEDDCEDSPKIKKKAEPGVYKISMVLGSLSCEVSGPSASWVAKQAEPLTQFFIMENRKAKEQDKDVV